MGSYPGTVQTNFLGQRLAKGKVISAVKNANHVPNQVIDGFVKAPQSSSPLTHKAARQVSATAHGLHRRGQKAQTLVRGALKSPAGGFNNRIQNLKPGLNPQREARAKQTAKHAKVNRFGGQVSTAETSPRKPVLQGEVISRPVHRRAQPQPSATAAVAMPSMVTSASHHQIERMLDSALMRADSHKQAMKYQAARHFWQKPGFLGRHRWLKLSSLAVLVLGVSFFIAWQKVPQLSIRVAGMRAHLSATTPAYKPSGYSFSPASAEKNSVTMKYASSGDKTKAYIVKEQPSNQDSDSLMADNTSSGQQVQTAQANGVPIIIVQGRAMCVSNHIKATITDKSGLPRMRS